MRKILISIIIILLIIMAYLVIFKGLVLGNFQILSTTQIIDENDKLTQEISATETLMNVNYPTTTDNLNKSISNLLKAENEYLDLASVSTEAELMKASTVETYTVEFLWTVLGRHATSKGVNLNYTPKNDNTIEFTVVGDYIPVLEFITDVENDSRLGFTIENFKLVLESGNLLRATFKTSNVTVKKELITPTVENQSVTTQNTTTQTTDNQSTTAE